MTVIDVKNLKKNYRVHKKEPGIAGSLKSLVARKYETVSAVDDISFEIQEGELIGFIGPNGAGKTTTLKCLSGLLYPTSGHISVLGYNPFERKPSFLKDIALVMGQKNQLWWDLPPMDTFILNKEIYGISDSDFKKTLDELVELLEIKDILKVQVKKLSLGQRMKCELVASLIHQPKVLFLDEPTIGLDVVMQENLRTFIREYNERFKSTIILTSHYMGDVEALCKRIIIINKGKLLFDGELADFVKKHAPYKIIRMTLREKVEKTKFAGFGELKSYEYPEVVLKIDGEHASDVTYKALRSLPIQDFNIEGPDVEDVIRDFFRK